MARVTQHRFLPDRFADAIRQHFLDGIESTTELLLGPEEHRRKGHLESTPYTSDELAARKRAVRKWKRLTRELEHAGWLEHEACYECGGELVPSTEDEHREWVYDETVEDHASRTANMTPYQAPHFVFATKRIEVPNG